MPQSAPSPHPELLQEVVVTTKECSRGGRVRLRSLDPLATAHELQNLPAGLACGAAVGMGRWHGGRGATSPVFQCREELSWKNRHVQPDVARKTIPERMVD